ncbi:hypothetical protein [Streptomyces sp. NPDC008122]|uniref:hypothetical protein n=1 Tax=Streptomyces sp. NPDC008122 TaxID=3364810 RepID=UPI0036DFD02A
MDVVTSGTVLGAKPTDSPDQVSAIMGSDFAENSLDDHSMWRDYGLVEFFWTRESPDHPWEGHHFALQVHRLSYAGSSLVNKSIRERYGRFGRHLRFDKLQQLLANRGVRLEDVPDANAPAFTLHWQPASQVSVMALREREWGTVPTARQRPDRRRAQDLVIDDRRTSGMEQGTLRRSGRLGPGPLPSWWAWT